MPVEKKVVKAPVQKFMVTSKLMVTKQLELKKFVQECGKGVFHVRT